jgi:hypothetical protein
MFMTARFIEKTNFMSKPMDFAFLHCCFDKKQFLVRTKYWCTLLLPTALDFTVHIRCPSDWLLVL